MISDQCDKLRDMADELARVTKGIRSGVPASTWRGMTYVFEDAARSLRGAADTIWELSCKLSGVVDQRDEIKRLRAEIWEQKQTIEHQRRENVNWGEQYHSLAVENIRIRQLVARMYRDMQGVLDRSTDTVFVDRMTTLRDCMDVYMECMAELGMPPCDYESRRRELGIEVSDV